MRVNARILQAPLTGVKRYLSAMLEAWPEPQPQLLSPPKWAAHGPGGHAWEQFVLPARLAGELLWSPVHSGPLAVRNQVVTVHDLVPLDHPEWLSPGFASWYRFMLPRLLRQARHVIAISRFTRSRLLEMTDLPAARISVVANGVASLFQPPCSEQAGAAEVTMRQQLGLGEFPYLLSVGTLEPRKNLERLLAAWSRALPGLPRDLHLVIAGAPGSRLVFAGSSGRCQSRLPERVVRLGRVADEQLPMLYAAAEWFVYLSLYEGFGLPPLEALACGTPVIISDLEVFDEVVTDAAVRVDPTDIDAIARCLQRAVADRQRRAALAERARPAAAPFTWQSSARQTATILARFD
ncbi:MAG: glycosyltransferase family 4 protein [Xanthomonadaceae bacterium]|nr:glycosyltransferase family 4 protein [Xanthomonadaceae bacterium]